MSAVIASAASGAALAVVANSLPSATGVAPSAQVANGGHAVPELLHQCCHVAVPYTGRKQAADDGKMVHDATTALAGTLAHELVATLAHELAGAYGSELEMDAAGSRHLCD